MNGWPGRVPKTSGPLIFGFGPGSGVRMMASSFGGSMACGAWLV